MRLISVFSFPSQALPSCRSVVKILQPKERLALARFTRAPFRVKMYLSYDRSRRNGGKLIAVYRSFVLLVILLCHLSSAFQPSSPVQHWGRSRGDILCKKGSSSGSGPPASKGFGFGAKKEAKGDKFKYTGRLKPGVLSPPRDVPADILRPDYALDGMPKARDPPLPWMIEVKSPEDIAAMRASGLVAREVLDAVGRQIKVGMTTDEIDSIAHGETIKRGAYPSPLNYQGFPKSCCTSLNEVVCHGIPDVSTKLQDGDIVNVDVTVYYKGYHGDCSETFCVGNVDEAGKRLVKVTYDAWQKAIEFCKPGRPYKDIGAIIEEYVTKEGFTTVREFCGHGVGKVFHTTPNILHFKNSQPAGVMQPGHTFTIEPMICEGTNKHILWPDKWTATTADGRRSAQFEHTLLITPSGVEALTGRLPTSPKFFWEV